MPSPYSKAQLLKIYQTLPEPLKEVLGSAETQDEIDTICRENQVTDAATIDSVYNLVMDVCMGLVTPTNFDQHLVQILKMRPGSTQEIAHRIRRFVLFPLKAEVAQLHKEIGEAEQEKPEVGAATPRHSDRDDYMVRPEPAESPAQSDIQATPPQSEPLDDERQKPDSYREPLK